MAARAGRRFRGRFGKLGPGGIEELLDFARHQFDLIRKLPDGTSKRDNLESYERQTGIRPPELEGPPLPTDLAHIWGWFTELSAARGSSGFGPNPISYPDILAWTLLTGTVIRPAEIAAITAVDHAWLIDQAASAASKGKT